MHTHKNEDKIIIQLKLKVRPYNPNLFLGRLISTLIHLVRDGSLLNCKSSTIIFLKCVKSLSDSNEILILQRLKACSPQAADSLLSLIEGYYRLMVNQYKSLRLQGKQDN